MKLNVKLTALASSLAILGAILLSPASFADSNITVQPGDTLSSIAAVNQTTFVRIYNANDEIKNPNVIYAGMNIRIPAADEKLPDRYSAFMNPNPSITYASNQARSKYNQSNNVRSSYNYSKQIYKKQSPVKSSIKSTPSPSGSVWDKIAECESSGNWSINTGNGYYGGLQFTSSTWSGYGGGKYAPSANQATREQQIEIAKKVQASQGWGAWPACTSKLGIR